MKGTEARRGGRRQLEENPKHTDMSLALLEAHWGGNYKQNSSFLPLTSSPRDSSTKQRESLLL